MKMIIFVASIVALLIYPVHSRQCYMCSCNFDWQTNSGTCSSIEFLSSCILVEVGDKLCFITSSYNGNLEQRVYEAISANIFQDQHFIQAVERISLSDTEWLPTSISSISYGCDWNGCNLISLAEYLPESFQITINETVLNSELLGEQSTAQHCYSCSACINELTAILCKQEPCANGTCYIDEIHSYMKNSTNNCTYNFLSLCRPFSGSIQASSVRIRATYYIDLPEEQQLEINEAELTCIKDYCNSIQTIENIKGNIKTKIILHPDFQPSRFNTTTTTTTTNTTTITTTTMTTTTTTTSPSSKSTSLYSTFYLIMFFILLVV